MNRSAITPGRTARLRNDLSEMQKLSRRVPAIRFVKGSISAYPDHYKIDIDIQGLIKNTEHTEPIRHDGFRLDIKLPLEYPHSSLPQCLISPFPFHPHFQKYKIEDFGFETIPYYLKDGGSWGVWISYELRDQGLGMFVLDVVRSLKYEPDFISENAQQIGNPRALQWYMQMRLQHPDVFPIDKSPMPETIHSPEKKFAVRHKFDMQTNDVESNTDQSVSDSLVSPHTETVTKKFAINEVVKKTFRIEELSPAYQLEECEMLGFPTFLPTDSRNPCSTHEIYILPHARQKIFDHICWEKHSNGNIVEQGGILLGRVYIDSNTKIVFAVIQDAIAGQSARGTSAYLEMGHDTWKEMIDLADEMLDLNPEKDLQIVGWYHTHPNQLDVFMSGTDKNTQQLIFAEDWQYAIVLNPQKQIWRAFHGGNSEECKGFMVKDNDNKAKEFNTQPSSEDVSEKPDETDSILSTRHFVGAIVIVSLLLFGILGLIQFFYPKIFPSSLDDIPSEIRVKQQEPTLANIEQDDNLPLNTASFAECQYALLLDEVDNNALTFLDQIVVSDVSADNVDIVLHVLDDELYFFSPHLLDRNGHRTRFAVVDEPFDVIKTIPLDKKFSDRVVLSTENTVIVVSQNDVHAKITIVAIEGKSPERFVKLSGCYWLESE